MDWQMAVCQPDNITEQHNIKGGMTVTIDKEQRS